LTYYHLVTTAISSSANQLHSYMGPNHRFLRTQIIIKIHCQFVKLLALRF